MRNKLVSLLLSVLMALALLSGCGCGQQAAESPSGEPEGSSPEQPVEETRSWEDSVPTEVPDIETKDDGNNGEESVPSVPQPPSTSAGQTEQSSNPGIGVMDPESVPAAPPAQEAPSEALTPLEPALEDTAEENSENEEANAEMKMTVQVGASTFTATLEDNAAVDALVEMLESGPITIQMSDYAGFEKVGALGTSLPTSNSQTTTQAGDIVLYQGNQIVIFYGSNSWSYTCLGKIDDLTGWAEALGGGDVSVTFSLGA